MSKETKLPAIPNSTDPAVKALKEATEVRLGRRGDPLDRGLTVRDLYENGVITVSGLPEVPIVGGGTGGLPISPRPIIGDTSQPPAPTNLVTAGGFTGIIVSWSKPQRKDLTANVYRNTVDNISTAVLIGIAAGEIFSDSVSHESTYYYWVRFVSAAEVTGPFNATAGTVAVTSSINDATPDASINVAKIANLTVDMASVTGTLTASQIGSASITSDKIAATGISADKITMDGNIEFANTSSGVQFGKTALGDSQAGAFFGRSGSIAGFSISSSTSGIYADSQGTVSLNNVRLYTGSAGSALERFQTGSYTANLSSLSTHIYIIIVGAGGGACNNASGTLGGGLSGSNGTASYIQWYAGLNGTGTLLQTNTAAGGAGLAAGSVGANNNGNAGYAGQASSKAAGGNGTSYQGGDGGHGSFGSGGGGAGGISTWNGSADAHVNQRAGAGTTVSQLEPKPSGAQSVKMFVGTGGTGGASQSQTYNNNSGNWTGFNLYAGGNGGNGFVSIADPNSGGIEVDLLSILNRLSAGGL